MARARLERDGDVGVLVLDDPPLNLFGREVVGDILAALDEAEDVRALLVRAGPTRAHHATKRIVRAYLEHGVRWADERTAGIGAPLFETEDLQGAVKSSLSEGPGKAGFTGR